MAAPARPPDPPARAAIWDRYLTAIPHGDLDMAAIVEESRLFTPADIEFAARRTSQLVFERVLFERFMGALQCDAGRKAGLRGTCTS